MVAPADKNTLQTKLEKSILLGLVFEWEATLWVLNRDHRNRMCKPFFSLNDSKTRLGSWCLGKREISLTRGLVLNHSWDAVREVLLHEMAHQLADEVLGSSDEPPHGPTFRRACCLLRANPKASGRHAPLDKRIFHDTCEKEDGLVARIRKLMALGKSENRYEAEAAMAKAHALTARHNLSVEHRQRPNNYVSAFLGQPKLRHRREEYCLANLLQDFYFVYGIWVSAYVVGKEKMGRALEISGTIQNVQTASYVFDFVHRYINTQSDLYTRYSGDGKLTGHRKTDFATGIIEGFRSSLSSKRRECPPRKNEMALMKRGDTMLAEYAAHKYPRVVQFKRTASRHNARIYEDGVAIGKQLVVAKGIPEKPGGKIALLER